MIETVCERLHGAAQGHACGAVVLRPLATAAVLHAGAQLAAGARPSAALLGRCGRGVTCLLAAAWEGVPAGLLAGDEDGAVAAWRLLPRAAPLFRISLHSGPARHEILCCWVGKGRIIELLCGSSERCYD